MTVNDQRTAVPTTGVPQPRSPEKDPEPAGEFPWPEPWHFSRGARPRSEIWDVETASWRSRGPAPAPRSGD